MRRISTRAHGMIDYGMAVLLILSPWIFGLEDTAAVWTLVAAGGVVLLTALMTDYELGLVHMVPMRAHLALDGLLGLFLIISPWLFGFSESTWVLHVVLGLAEIGGAAMTQTSPSYRSVTHAGTGL